MHFPFATLHRCSLVGPRVQLVGNREAVARKTRWQLEETGAILTSPALALMGKITLFNTGQIQPLQATTRHSLELT